MRSMSTSTSPSSCFPSGGPKMMTNREWRSISLAAALLPLLMRSDRPKAYGADVRSVRSPARCPAWRAHSGDGRKSTNRSPPASSSCLLRPLTAPRISPWRHWLLIATVPDLARSAGTGQIRPHSCRQNVVTLHQSSVWAATVACGTRHTERSRVCGAPASQKRGAARAR